MVDQYGRTIDYIRISVTDRCNLRCIYCMPGEGIKSIPHGEILTYEEIMRVARVIASIGVSKIKITGGEPLVRKNTPELVRQIKKIEGILNVTLTTNGVLFENLGEELFKAGLDAVNFSLDSLDRGTYCAITGADALPDVIKGIECSLRLGLRTKINCVPVSGLNAGDTDALAELAKRYPLDVRFIELMPIGLGEKYLPVENKVILKMLEDKYGEPMISASAHGNGPAVYYDFPGFCGSIGLISALSDAFCEKCNRIRLMSDGKLKACLCLNQYVDLKPLLRNGATDDQLRKTVETAVFDKPQRHHLLGKTYDKASETKKMVQIGG